MLFRSRLQKGRESARLARVEVPLIVSVGRDAPTNYRFVPAAPHPADVLRFEKVFTVTVEEVPVSFLRAKVDDNRSAVGREFVLVAGPASLSRVREMVNGCKTSKLQENSPELRGAACRSRFPQNT